ncbi:hypothetical protein KM043_012974 [Ampulex compressa]|nr:hypothetical protein KM043_012974 [Ampulex compressa]
MKARLSEIEDDIAYLEKKKVGLNNMKEAYLGASKTFTNRSYNTENAVTKRLFKEVKKDLHTVVDTLFPNNDGFKELLANLTSAYIKGGDDIYVDINPEVLSYVKYLIEADIVIYHRNDKSKIRMADML